MECDELRTLLAHRDAQLAAAEVECKGRLESMARAMQSQSEQRAVALERVLIAERQLAAARQQIESDKAGWDRAAKEAVNLAHGTLVGQLAAAKQQAKERAHHAVCAWDAWDELNEQHGATQAQLAAVRTWLLKMKEVESYLAHLRGCKCRTLDPVAMAKLDIGEYATFTDEHCTCGLTAALADPPRVAPVDRLTAENARLHALVAEAENYIDPEQHVAWHAGAFAETGKCDVTFDKLKRLTDLVTRHTRCETEDGRGCFGGDNSCRPPFDARSMPTTHDEYCVAMRDLLSPRPEPEGETT